MTVEARRRVVKAVVLRKQDNDAAEVAGLDQRKPITARDIHKWGVSLLVGESLNRFSPCMSNLYIA